MAAIYKPERELFTKLTLPDLDLGFPSLQNCKKVHFCLSHAVYSILLWKPHLIKTIPLDGKEREASKPTQGGMKGSEGSHSRGHTESHYSSKLAMVTSLLSSNVLSAKSSTAVSPVGLLHALQVKAIPQAGMGTEDHYGYPNSKVFS